MRRIAVLVPTFNEEQNILSVYHEVSNIMAKELCSYDWYIVFIDNASTDGTKGLIRALAQQDSKHVRAIFNATNFGYLRSYYYGLINAGGDCVIALHADLQNPPSLIPEFVSNWEMGSKVVLGIKTPERENPVMMLSRKLYYSMMDVIAQTRHVKNLTDFYLLDKDFVGVLKSIDDPIPYTRGIIAELGFKVSEVHYDRSIRKRGKSHIGFFAAYDTAMLGITTSSKALLRSATFVGTILAIACIIIAISMLVTKITNWDSFQIGSAAVGVGTFFIGAVVLIYLGILGEYILAINQRILHRPLVTEEERINFGETDPDENQNPPCCTMNSENV
jgi:glycosyltransferase involved in cell wall biosynthesis